MFPLNRFETLDSSFQVRSSKGNDTLVTTLCSLDQFHQGGMIFIKNKKYYQRLLDKLHQGAALNDIGVVFQNTFLKTIAADEKSGALDRFAFYATVESVDLALSRFSKLFYDEVNARGNDLVDGRKTATATVDPTSAIAENVFLGAGVTIGAHVVIHSGCVILSYSTIGEHTVLYPNVVIYRNVHIGKNCRIHANTTVGSDGYGYNYFKGEHLKVWHFGGVVIKDSVEIGSGTSIDQGTFSPTIIGEGTKIDNQVHMGHNCKIGKGVLITGQAGFSGSVTVGDYVVMGGCANFAPDVVVGKYAQIGGLAGVTADVPEGAKYAGYPARPLNEFLRSVAALRKLALADKGAGDRDK
jgi:UDP-3-O-[3-hydroxymyristoyl] glucosamine N-acyltransferase